MELTNIGPLLQDDLCIWESWARPNTQKLEDMSKVRHDPMFAFLANKSVSLHPRGVGKATQAKSLPQLLECGYKI